MGISENFLVNTKSFDPIIQALMSRSEHPDTITDTTLEKMGFDNPSDLLVLHVLRGLDIIHQDKTPSDLYFKMVDPEHTKEAIAEGVINGYKDLFLERPDIHKMLPGDIQEELKEYFDGKKTDLIIKYIANTFHKLVSYAGIETVEEARDRILGDELRTVNEQEEKETTANVDAETEEVKHEAEQADKPATETSNNGKSRPDFKAASEQEEISSRSVEEILFGDKPKAKESEEAMPDEKGETSSEAGETEQEESIPASSDSDGEEDSPVQEYKPEETSAEEEEHIGEREHMSDEPDETVPSSSLSGDDGISLSRLDTSDERIQKAVVRRSELQYKLGHYNDALESCEEIISYFDDADEKFLKQAVNEAVLRRVELVRKLDQDHKLLPALNEVIRRFSNSEKREYYDRASKAMLQKAELLETRDFDRQDLLPLYNKIINRLEDEADPYIQEKVNEIFIRRLKLLNRADDPSELLKALEQSTTRFADDRRFRKYLEETMFRKAEILEEMNRDEEALEAYTSFLEEFGETVDS